MKEKRQTQQSVAKMINLGLKSTTKVVAEYTAALTKSKQSKKLAGVPGPGQRKSS